MGYTIDYSNILDAAERDAAALQDAREWIGDAGRFDRVLSALQGMNEKTAMFALSIAGVSGPPARAMYREAKARVYY